VSEKAGDAAMDGTLERGGRDMQTNERRGYDPRRRENDLKLPPGDKITYGAERKRM